MAHLMQLAPATARGRYLVAESEGWCVGWAMAAIDWASTTPTDAFASLAVHPDHRRTGVGSALWTALDGHLREIGAVTVRMHGDENCGAFAESRGFHLTSTNTVLRVDPGRIPSAPISLDGVFIDGFADHLDDLERLYAVDVATMQDEPGDHDFAGLSFADWLRETRDHPDFAHDLTAVATVGGEVVGLSLLNVDREHGTALNVETGVLRTHRGRGIGLALKRTSLGRAATAGITDVFATNDETNAAMLAINRKLGYKPVGTRTTWRRG
jgi:GNAT superfamily N-acetyltransferase